MDTLISQLEHATQPVLPKRRDYRIGIIGAGLSLSIAIWLLIKSRLRALWHNLKGA